MFRAGKADRLKLLYCHMTKADLAGRFLRQSQPAPEMVYIDRQQRMRWHRAILVATGHQRGRGKALDLAFQMRPQSLFSAAKIYPSTV